MGNNNTTTIEDPFEEKSESKPTKILGVIRDRIHGKNDSETLFDTYLDKLDDEYADINIRKSLFNQRTFTGREIENKNFKGFYFNECDLSKSRFTECNFQWCVFEKCNIEGTYFDKCNFYKCKFINSEHSQNICNSETTFDCCWNLILPDDIRSVVNIEISFGQIPKSYEDEDTPPPDGGKKKKKSKKRSKKRSKKKF